MGGMAPVMKNISPLISLVMYSRPLIAVITDFGYSDYYVGAMKGVIKTLCPSAEIIDITHDVPPWSILEASYILECCLEEFPRGTVFLVVVDPGVGTERKAVVARGKRYLFVGPDNGVLVPALRRDAPFHAWSIEREEFKWWKSSGTFHGRDVFAPAAARIACGASPAASGPPVERLVETGVEPPSTGDGYVYGSIVHVDRFGNAATSIERRHLAEAGLEDYGELRIEISDPATGRGTTFTAPVRQSFAYIEAGDTLLLFNSCRKLEIAVNRGSAAKRYGLRPGVKLRLSRP